MMSRVLATHSFGTQRCREIGTVVLKHSQSSFPSPTHLQRPIPKCEFAEHRCHFDLPSDTTVSWSKSVFTQTGKVSFSPIVLNILCVSLVFRKSRKTVNHENLPSCLETFNFLTSFRSFITVAHCLLMLPRSPISSSRTWRVLCSIRQKRQNHHLQLPTEKISLFGYVREIDGHIRWSDNIYLSLSLTQKMKVLFTAASMDQNTLKETQKFHRSRFFA